MDIAHTKNYLGYRQPLEEHLRNVAEMASQFCVAFEGKDCARYAGLLHDIGKHNPGFQHYLLQAEQNPMKHLKGPDHKGAGTVLAQVFERKGSLACIVSGHHGGMPAIANLPARIHTLKTKQVVREAIATAKNVFPELHTAPEKILPSFIRTSLELELFTRMVFSALVDADFLDTERHFNGGKRPERGSYQRIPELWRTFEEAYKRRFMNVSQNQLNTIRAEVYQHCSNAASLSPGFFRLTVPTGGGKTLSSLEFALSHALKNKLERVIYAIPYTSIIEQTANVFRDLLGNDQTFIEHHSNISVRESDDSVAVETRRRLAAENWDASLILTTTVQLFESLMGCSTSACRKLHNIAKSVIVLDEAQMLPVYYLTPILNLLHQLVAHYSVTVVLCTATQPDLESRKGFEGLPDIHEIIPEPKRYFELLKRVEYQLPRSGETWTWEAVADRVQGEQQILVIVNTRRDALEIMDILQRDQSAENDSALFHLSTRLCGAHRRAVLEEVRRRLDEKELCRLIATQVVEAGVDVDFPLVMRAIGPLDSIVQAAGRANREGKLPHAGKLIVFVPEEGHTPKGSYTTATDIAKGLLKEEGTDLHDPALYQQYFRQYYGYPYHDYYHIQELRKSLNYPEVARTFRMIEDESISVVVKYQPAEETITSVLERIRQSAQIRREDFRTLQPYTVNLLKNEFKKSCECGLIKEVIPGIWECDTYDSGEDGIHGRGIVLDGTLNVESCIW